MKKLRHSHKNKTKRICCEHTCLQKLLKGVLSLKWAPDSSSNSHEELKNTSECNQISK